MHGFEMAGSAEVPALRARIEQYLHPQSGARHIHMATDSRELSFVAGFPSLPETSDGCAHVLEHLVLSGSRRFPVRAPFFSMQRRSLATHMNARTEADRAAYLFASTDRQDYFNLLDVYLDACFFPRLDCLDFLQEGWRHVFRNGELTFQGVVFNEMKGVFADPLHALKRGIVAPLLAGTTYAFDAGGDPLAIPDLSLARLRAFHARHYHPSHAVFMSAGAIAPADIQQRIALRVLADGVGERRPRLLPALAAPWAAPRAQRLPADGHGLQMAWLLGETRDTFGRGCAELLATGLPLRAAMESAGFGGPSRLNGVDTDMRQLVFHAGMDGMGAVRGGAARRLILSTLERVAQDGVPQASLGLVLRELRFRQRDTSGGGHTPFALHRLLQALPLALYGGDVMDSFDTEPVLSRLGTQIRDPAFFKGLVRALLENPTRLDSQRVPDPGRLAARAAAERHMLVARQAALSAGERAGIERDAAALAARQALPADTAPLPRIRPADISAPVPGPHASANGIVRVRQRFDVAHLDADDWPWLDLYVRLLPRLGAPQCAPAIDAALAPDGGLQLAIVFSAAGLEEDEADLAELLRASVTGVRFDDTARLASLFRTLAQERRHGVAGAGRHYALWAACAPLSPVHHFRHLAEGAPALEFYSALARQCRRPDGLMQLAARLAGLHRGVTTAGAAPARAACMPALRAANLALLADGQVNHCIVAWRAPGPADPDAAPLAVAAELLAARLHRSLREQGGAYGAFAQYDGDARVLTMGSVHDPRLAATYADCAAALDAVTHGALDPAAVDEGIVGAIRTIDRPSRPHRETLRADVLACTPARIQAAVGAWLAPGQASRAAWVGMGIAGQDLAGFDAVDLRDGVPVCATQFCAGRR